MSRLIAAIILGALCAVNGFAAEKPKPAATSTIHLDRDGERWAEKTLRKMTLEEKIGQLFMIWVRAGFLNTESPDYQQLVDQMHKYHVGSFAMTVRWEPPFLYRSQPFEAADLLNRLQRESKLPLLIAADFERGVTMRVNGGTEFPHAMAFGATGDTKFAEEFGRVTAEESRAIGVHWNFFPDTDVNSNPANPIINTRSFGEDPRQVGELAAAYIRGAHEGGMMVTAKHFPGHGDTATDSHVALAQITGDRARLEAVELPPFESAIAAGVDAVMIAHLAVPTLDPDPSHVATTSHLVVTDLLKDQLGFRGIVVTDALDMAGVTRLYAANPGRAAVDAFKAGNDLLLIPADLDVSYRAMLEASHSGEIPAARLDASVLTLLKAKAALGLHKNRTVDIEALPDRIGKPENLAIGQAIADQSITLIRDNGKVLPLKSWGTSRARAPYQDRAGAAAPNSGPLLVVIFSDDVRTEAGRILERQIKSRVTGATVIYVDDRIASALSNQVKQEAAASQAVVTAIYSVPSPGKAPVLGSAEGSNPSGILLKDLLERSAEKTVVLTMGNPYLAQNFPELQNYVCAFSNATVSEMSAVKALFGEIPFHGHLPVTIPNIAERGFGLSQFASAGEINHAN